MFRLDNGEMAVVKCGDFDGGESFRYRNHSSVGSAQREVGVLANQCCCSQVISRCQSLDSERVIGGEAFKEGCFHLGPQWVPSM